MARGEITAKPNSPEAAGAFAAFGRFCDKVDISPNNFFNTILPKLLFCLENYTRVDEAGNPIVIINLGETTILTREHVAKKPRGKSKQWDCAF